MNALAKLAITLCLSSLALFTQAQTQTISTVPPDFTRAELDQMLAPIALYPDTVLSHVLIAATYPLEVVQAARWANANSKLSAESAVDAVENQQWDPSVKALVAFPQVLQRMSDDLDWTQRVGDAFLADEAEVMDAIQELRRKAYAAGSLEKMEHVRVQQEEKIIVIEPSVERVVYVPYYDTRVVYGGWWWPDYPPVYWHHPHHHAYVGGFYWGPRIHVAPSFYFSSFHWHRRHVVVIDYHRHHHHHPRFYSARHIAHYDGAKHWRHNPAHRRGVVYRNDNVRHQYRSNRDSYRSLQEQRGHVQRRNDERPNNAQHIRREQGRNDQRSDNPRVTGQRPDAQRPANNTPRATNHWRGQTDAERVRERLTHGNASRQSDGDNIRRNAERTDSERKNTEQRQVRNTDKSGARENSQRPSNERPTAVYRQDNAIKRNTDNNEPQRSNAQREPSIERSNHRQSNAERPQANERPQAQQRQEIRRTENVQRPQRNTTNERRAEPSRQHTQSQRQHHSGNNTRHTGGSSGARESRRIER